jgi:hypothetical protein
MKTLNAAHDALVRRPDLEGVAREFQQWRSNRRKIERVPEALWQAAASLYPRYAVNRIARALRLNFVELRDRVRPKDKQKSTLNGSRAVGRSSTTDGLHFMELPATPVGGLNTECSVKVKDDLRRTRITIRLKGTGVGQMLAMLQGLWSRGQ